MLLRLAGHPFSKNTTEHFDSVELKAAACKGCSLSGVLRKKNLHLISLRERALRVTGPLNRMHACTVYMTLCWNKVIKQNGDLKIDLCSLFYNCHCFDPIALGHILDFFFPHPCHVLKRSFLWPAAVLWSVERSRAARAERKNSHLSKWVSLQPRLNVSAGLSRDKYSVFFKLKCIL